MRLDKAVARCAHVVDRSLRKCFPEDFDARCMYAAFGMHRLAQTIGLRSIVVAGDFVALSVAMDNSRASFQGYQRSEGDFAHYWGEIEDHIVDLGPSYLSIRSRYPAVRAPIVMWPMEVSLPPSLRYSPKIRYAPDVQFALEPEMMRRMDRFLVTCEAKFAQISGQPRESNWLVSSQRSIDVAAARGDLWALGSKRISKEAGEATYMR
ncbi:hypothetical protein LAZ40_11515 [Cereibacter sphaeroides]|uniref:hypothetical protein n=1 Tax=Cereibacter sphaeroides TaxID=1063 RepID=UPI001F2FDC9C|nr:hypothetical protein [Cereibacter sphaeroides]MCE6959646.1 hypothetical protein [Cereibacter sphaeroides]MCE6974493.1 hypothetical protein [Cereibacter sphaeroides]